MSQSGVAPFTATLGVWSPQTYVVTSAQIIQQELAPLGITIKIQQYGDYPSYNEAVFVNHTDGMTIQGFGGNLDPDDWLYRTFTTTGGYNYFGYSDPTVDLLLNQARQTTGFSARNALYAQAQKLIATDGPIAFLYSYSEPEAWIPAVQGFQHFPDVSLDGLITTWLRH